MSRMNTNKATTTLNHLSHMHMASFTSWSLGLYAPLYRPLFPDIMHSSWCTQHLHTCNQHMFIEFRWQSLLSDHCYAVADGELVGVSSLLHARSIDVMLHFITLQCIPIWRNSWSFRSYACCVLWCTKCSLKLVYSPGIFHIVFPNGFSPKGNQMCSTAYCLTLHIPHKIFSRDLVQPP